MIQITPEAIDNCRAACYAVDAIDPLHMGEGLFDTFLAYGFGSKTRRQALQVRLAMLECGKAATACGNDDAPYLSAYYAIVDAFGG